jgi:hypothetical protein
VVAAGPRPAATTYQEGGSAAPGSDPPPTIRSLRLPPLRIRRSDKYDTVRRPTRGPDRRRCPTESRWPVSLADQGDRPSAMLMR